MRTPLFRLGYRTRLLASIFPLLLAGCQTAPQRSTAALLQQPQPAAQISPSAARFAVDPQASEIRVLVYRAGPLARFGHDHVVIGRVRGEIRAGASAATSGFRLEIPVASFQVDPPAERAEEGAEFAEPVSAQAREGTRHNMLGAGVLDAAHYPLIRIESLSLAGPRWNPTVTARVTLRGATRDLRFPAAVFERHDTLTVIAQFRLDQTEFGIQPFSILGGGLRVRDALDIRLRIVARRA
ncbi:MAG TPA: YceI family protein [Burkholderiales bacterium]|nr:YceI family protein [Burkholderiales bacterium]